MESFPQLDTDRLQLYEIEERHVEAIYNLFTDREILQHYGMDPMSNISEAEALVKKFQVGFKHSTVIRWGIFLKSNNQLIGTCGFHNWHHRYYRAEIGYELTPDDWGNGYMRESLEAIVNYGFQKLDLHRIGALISPDNEASQNVIEKLGFQKEGLLKDYAFSGGKFHDLNMYAKINEHHTFNK